MIDGLDQIIEPLLKLIGRVVGAIIHTIVEVAFRGLPDIVVAVFSSYTDSMDRRGWSPWIYVPVALILTPITLLLPVAVCAAIGAAAFYALS